MCLMKYKLKCKCKTETITTKKNLNSENWERDANNRLIRRWKCENCFGVVRATKV